MTKVQPSFYMWMTANSTPPYKTHNIPIPLGGKSLLYVWMSTGTDEIYRQYQQMIRDAMPKIILFHSLRVSDSDHHINSVKENPF